MTTTSFNYSTGSTLLPDVGILRYNGCVFSPLFETSISGAVVKDNAQRTTKYMEYTLVADGYVTLDERLANDISATMDKLATLLTVQGGPLTYTGRGFDLVINQGTTDQDDVAWGPVPELMEFQPLGGGLSAKVVWKVTIRISEAATVGKLIPGGVLQFNYETSLSYAEDGYTSFTVRGTAEIPLTRPRITQRSLDRTVDDYRETLVDRIMNGIDLTRFRVVRRDFNGSRDKRTMEWSFTLEEKPYMDLPPFSTIARGSYSVRPAKAGAGLCTWLCTLRASYTVRADMPRRMAWVAFLSLVRLRMAESERGVITQAAANRIDNKPPEDEGPTLFGQIIGRLSGVSIVADIFKSSKSVNAAENARKAWLIDFSYDEGLYLDSKTTSFSCTWRLVTLFSHILVAGGLWRKLVEFRGNFWRLSMQDVSRSRSWLGAKMDPSYDVIVDFGGP